MLMECSSVPLTRRGAGARDGVCAEGIETALQVGRRHGLVVVDAPPGALGKTEQIINKTLLARLQEVCCDAVALLLLHVRVALGRRGYAVLSRYSH